ncbi:AmmeMemoRadiSam system radical SAM enzyme [Arcobacter sp. YIC-80]|uniref:AmmeMemoRadiSam system radical SAM enzyme n=1 Tax=Arcobacter sp. YIC-80 TaxID=3376683 RepID=UPI0038515794
MNFYKKQNDRLVCQLCSYYCKLKPNQTGICGVNKNTGDKIECLVYGYPAAMNIDPIEKKPLYHVLPQSKSFSIGTVGCNFRCSFCQNHGISQEHNINKTNYYSPKDIVKMAKHYKCETISYTYNEPTIFYPYAKDCAIEAKKQGIKNIYVSNGFESREVIDDMKGIIDAVNIDLKSFNESYYKKSLGGSLTQVLENLKHFKKNGIWVEVTTLIVPTKNDSKEELTKIAKFIKEELDEFTPWHVSAFHPDYKEMDLPNTSFESLKLANDIAKEVGLKYAYIGNIGFDNHTYCPNCNQSVLKRNRFQVLENKLRNGRCPNCNYEIQGVFSKMKTVRKTGFCGSFYPEKKEEILRYIDEFNKNFKVNGSFETNAMIVPHAGYVYSGFTANIAYNICKNKKPKRVIVIGPTHNVYYEKASVALYDEYETPFGNIQIDKEYSKQLIDKYDVLDFNEELHLEHSTETQAPFIKHYFPDTSIVEIIYGKIDYEKLSKVIDEFLDDEDNLILISTDLSHFHNQKTANKLDNICLNAIAKKDMSLFDKGCEACGKIGVKAVINSAIKKTLDTKVLHYCTSYDRTKDASRVVGYTSALIGKGK